MSGKCHVVHSPNRAPSCGSVNASNNYKKGGEGTTSDTFEAFFFLLVFGDVGMWGCGDVTF